MPARRLVVDTNVWVSMLLPGGVKAVGTRLLERRDIVLFSSELVAELVRVFAYPRITKLVPPARAEAFLTSLDGFGEKVIVRSVLNVCRDPEDDHLLALCADGKAALLVTGDKDLLTLGRFRSTRIITPAEYLDADPKHR